MYQLLVRGRRRSVTGPIDAAVSRKQEEENVFATVFDLDEARIQISG
jgi:hypothetical protein